MIPRLRGESDIKTYQSPPIYFIVEECVQDPTWNVNEVVYHCQSTLITIYRALPIDYRFAKPL